MGQAACSMVELPSDPEIRFALVPVSDAEASMALDAAARIDTEDNVAGLMRRDHQQRVELLAYAIRDPQDLSSRVYRTAYELQEQLDETDVNHIYDAFDEMRESSNPSIEEIPPQEFEELKKALQEMDWSGLSGRSWYAARRFLGALIQDGLLRDNSPGSISNTRLTTPSV
jgi:hypothetical protein